MLTTVLFDMGGTLEDIWYTPETRTAALARAREILQENGVTAGETFEAFRDSFERGYKEYKTWADAHGRELKPEEIWPDWYLRDFPEAKGLSPEVYEELANMWEYTLFHRELREGAEEMLRTLKARGWRLGVISNNSSLYNVFNVLENCGIRDLMEDVTVSSVTGYRKPNPEIFRISLRQMCVDASECVYVGDTPTKDIGGAQAMGFGATVLIASFLTAEREPDRTGLPVPDIEIRKLAELPDKLEQLRIERGKA